jgi:hypothetical protein
MKALTEWIVRTQAGAGRRRGQSTQAQAPGQSRLPDVCVPRIASSFQLIVVPSCTTAAPLETTRPSSRQATVRDIVEVTRARSQPQASEAGPTRPLPRPATANAALRGNRLVTELASAAPPCVMVVAHAWASGCLVGSAPAAPLVWDYDNYKVRSQILKEQLNRFEMSVLENANPTELNRIMRARGKMDHVWAVSCE